MNQEAFFKFHQEIAAQALEISRAKNNDYSAPDERPKDDAYAVFANFMQSERLGICSVEQGFLVRISDKLSRLCNLLRPGHERTVKDESVRDTCVDAINYLILMMAYIETKRNQQYATVARERVVIPKDVLRQMTKDESAVEMAAGDLRGQGPYGLSKNEENLVNHLGHNFGWNGTQLDLAYRAVAGAMGS